MIAVVIDADDEGRSGLLGVEQQWQEGEEGQQEEAFHDGADRRR